MKKLMFLMVAVFMFSLTALAFDVQRIVWDQNICSTNGAFCFRGNIEYDRKSKDISINGRFSKSSGPGIVTIWFEGVTSGGKRAVVHMSFKVRGRYSEIVRHSVYTGYWGQVDWHLDDITFEPLK